MYITFIDLKRLEIVDEGNPILSRLKWVGYWNPTGLALSVTILLFPHIAEGQCWHSPTIVPASSQSEL